MKPRDRMINALNFTEPDDMVPSWEIDFQLYKEIVGRELIAVFEFDDLSEKEKEKAIEYNAGVLVETAEKLDFSAICSLFGYWEISPGIPALNWIKEEKWRIRLIKTLKEIAGDRFLIIGCSDSTLGLPPGNKINEFVTMMYENPKEFIKNTQLRLDEGIKQGINAVEAGADAVFNASDIAFNTGGFFTPHQFDDFIGPFLEEWASTFKKSGIYTIYHTDGNLDKLMDKLVATGIDALQCIDPLAGMDIIRLKEQYYKKITLIGNVNTTTLHLGTKSEVEDESKKVLEGCKAGGGYIFGACNAIYKGIPPENYLAMVEAKRKYGRYGGAK